MLVNQKCTHVHIPFEIQSYITIPCRSSLVSVFEVLLISAVPSPGVESLGSGAGFQGTVDR